MCVCVCKGCRVVSVNVLLYVPLDRIYEGITRLRRGAFFTTVGFAKVSKHIKPGTLNPKP